MVERRRAGILGVFGSDAGRNSVRIARRTITTPAMDRDSDGSVDNHEAIKCAQFTVLHWRFEVEGLMRFPLCDADTTLNPVAWMENDAIARGQS